MSAIIVGLTQCLALSPQATRTRPPSPPRVHGVAACAGNLEVDTLVIGGGVSGLTTAFYVSKGGSKTLLAESAPALGGVIETGVRDGYQWEDGPNTFQASAKGMRRLAADLKLELIASDPKLPKFIYNDDELYALPKELPGLLSPGGLARAVAGVLLTPVASSPAEDETVASFVTRVLGEEVLRKVVEPFVSTVYTGDPTTMSLASVFPFLGTLAAAADDTPGGLLHCFAVSRKKRAAAQAAASTAVDWNLPGIEATIRPPVRSYGTLPEVPRGSSLSFEAGLGALPAAAARAMGEEVCRTSWTALSVEVAADGDGAAYDVRFATLEGERTVRAPTVVVCTPRPASLLGSLAPAARDLAAIRAPPVVALTLAYPRSSLAANKAVDEATGELRGFGVLLPRTAGFETLGFQFISSLFPARAPASEQLVLAYIGGARCSIDLASLTDEEIVSRVHSEARQLLLRPDAPEPTVVSVRRWEEGIPQYEVGHAALVAAVREQLPRTKAGGVLLGGSASGGGISLGDCAEAGYACAQEALGMSRYRAAMKAAREV